MLLPLTSIKYHIIEYRGILSSEDSSNDANREFQIHVIQLHNVIKVGK